MITIIANKQRLCIGCMFLAALLLIGFNGHQYMAMEDQPLKGYSTAIKSIDRKMTQLEKGLAAQTAGFDDMAEFQLSLARYVKAPDPISQQETVADPISERPSPDASEKQQPVILPKCSGIVMVQNSVGALGYKAVIDGQLVQEKDRIQDFTVHEITPKSVVLSRLNQQWSIAGPSAAYTSDSGK